MGWLALVSVAVVCLALALGFARPEPRRQDRRTAVPDRSFDGDGSGGIDAGGNGGGD